MSHGLTAFAKLRDWYYVGALEIDMSLPEQFGAFFGRFIASCIITAVLAVGGVWFVVDISLRGIEEAVRTTNARIGKIEDRLAKIDDRLFAMQSEILKGIRDTPDQLKKASVERTSLDRSIAGAIPYTGLPNYIGANPDEWKPVTTGASDKSSSATVREVLRDTLFDQAIGSTSSTATTPEQTPLIETGPSKN